MNKTLNTIPVIIHSNLEKNNQILMVFGINIPDTTGHQMSIQVSSLPNICFCIT